MLLSEYLFAKLKEVGVEQVFGVPGDYNLELLDVLVDSEVEYIGCCNELNAGYAADGYARIKGLGVVITTYAVGELSVLNAVAGSLAERVPVLQITGAPKTQDWRDQRMLHHTFYDYHIPFKMYSEISCAAEIIFDINNAQAQIDRCISTCLKEKKPAYLVIPADMPIKKLPSIKLNSNLSLFNSSDKTTLESVTKFICQNISEAKRAVLVPGVLLKRYQIVDQFKKLLEITGLPYTTMMMSKGIIGEDHPQFIGMYSIGTTTDEVENYLENSDLIVILGEMLTDFNTKGFTASLYKEKTLIIHDDYVAKDDQIFTNVYIKNVLESLITKVEKKQIADYPKQSGILPQNLPIEATKNLKQILSMNGFFQAINNWLGKNLTVVAETGSSMFAMGDLFFNSGNELITQLFYGSIGYTIGATLGIGIANKTLKNGKRTVLFIGDGSFQVTAQDLSRYISNNLDIIVFIIDNDGYTIERAIDDNIYNDIPHWDYAEIPRVFGGEKGHLVRNYEELLETFTFIDQNPGRTIVVQIILGRNEFGRSLELAGQNMAETNEITYKHSYKSLKHH